MGLTVGFPAATQPARSLLDAAPPPMPAPEGASEAPPVDGTTHDLRVACGLSRSHKFSGL